MERITLPCETMTMNERTLKESRCPVKPWQWMKGHWRNHTALWSHDNEWKDFAGITLPCETMTMNERTLRESHCPVKPWQWIWHWMKGFDIEWSTLAEITLWNHDNEFDIDRKGIDRNHTVKFGTRKMNLNLKKEHWQKSHCETITIMKESHCIFRMSSSRTQTVAG